ncbi:hypothetical protein RDABS01_022200 [Bienertia sinuspersici]
MENSRKIGIDKSFRIMVMIDVRKPLILKIKIKMRGGMEELFYVKYERLPLFCFFCGRIRHGMKDYGECQDEEEPVHNYGVWMKASPRKTLRKENPISKEKAPSCARKLFVTKLKQKVALETKEQVNKIMKKLREVEIREN